jgi:hypothetical protein
MATIEDAAPYRMTPSEIAHGYITDAARHRARVLVEGPLPTPREVIEAILLEAVQRQPCIVGFSGGRDSSALLAVGTLVARREGLPDPVPATRRYPGFAETDEDQWQEQVIRHLGLQEWERIDLDDGQLDLVGPVAAQRLLAYGVLWPALLHQDAPLLDLARGGVLIDGEGGDQILGLEVHRIAPITLARRAARRRTPRQAVTVAGTLVPSRLRGPVERYRLRSLEAQWLRTGARAELIAALAKQEAQRPLRWDASLRVFLQNRARRLAFANREYFARRSDVTYVHPFIDRCFIEAMARSGGGTGLGTRTQVMWRLFGDLLPSQVLERRSKARFNQVVHGRWSREFVERWDGRGLDEGSVDLDGLRREWEQPSPSGRTHSLLQAAWLDDHRKGAPLRP